MQVGAVHPVADLAAANPVARRPAADCQLQGDPLGWGLLPWQSAPRQFKRPGLSCLRHPAFLCPRSSGAQTLSACESSHSSARQSCALFREEFGGSSKYGPTQAVGLRLDEEVYSPPVARIASGSPSPSVCPSRGSSRSGLGIYSRSFQCLSFPFASCLW